MTVRRATTAAAAAAAAAALALLLVLTASSADALSAPAPARPPTVPPAAAAAAAAAASAAARPPSRRDVLSSAAATTLASMSLAAGPSAADAYSPGGLASKLSKRDPSELKNSVFNVPPPAQVHPHFMRGEWKVTSKFAGFLFPSSKIPKSKVTADVTVPGFQKCSIAAFCDVGREVAEYGMRVDGATGLEDRAYVLKGQIDSNLGYGAVREVLYDARSNPNRLSVQFVPNRTRNAERIELFCNARESELVPNPNDESLKIFVCSEYARQVTFSLSQEFGVARQVVGNYAHFWTWRERPGGDEMTGNVLTAAYLDPQDPLFFDEPSKPVVVYSHELSARRVAA